MCSFSNFLLFLMWDNRHSQLIDFKSNKIQKQRKLGQKQSLHAWDVQNGNCVTSQVLGATLQNANWHSHCILRLTKPWHPEPSLALHHQFPLHWSMGYNWLGKTSMKPEEAFNVKPRFLQTIPHVTIHAYHTNLCPSWRNFFTEDTR